ncbi:MAG: ATP-binding protein [Clostridia bacterium]|nr:ATP-binding protein [Clostridia bacterium]
MDDMKEALAECCKKLRLSASLASRAMTQQGENNQEFLLNLLTSEIANREAARIARNMNMAGFPCRYRVEQYRTDEIDFPDGVSFESLLALDFYKGGKNVIMYGGTGTGKTMLSILIGMAACRENIPVRFYRVATLINLLAESKQEGTLSQFKKKKLNPAKILLLDEFGYVPYDRVGSELLFDYLSEIHEQKSIVLNTNLEFSQWVNVLYDKRMTTALIGRLIQHVELILFPGENNRLRESSINQAFARTNARQGVDA